jgi:hypothetical protein
MGCMGLGIRGPSSDLPCRSRSIQRAGSGTSSGSGNSSRASPTGKLLPEVCVVHKVADHKLGLPCLRAKIAVPHKCLRKDAATHVFLGQACKALACIGHSAHMQPGPVEAGH